MPTNDKSKSLFYQYNREADLVRCPYGRSSVRRQLDAYAKGAVNLYGAIRRQDLVDLFNQQNEDQTDPEELYVLLLPLVYKKQDYGFYKDYLVHSDFLSELLLLDPLIQIKETKPLYRPEKEELLAYANQDLVDNDAWREVLFYMLETFGVSKTSTDAFYELRDHLMTDGGISQLGSIMETYGLYLEFEDLQDFLNLLTEAHNHTRLWENNGYTPAELHEMERAELKERDPFTFEAAGRVGRNEPCPCGSGKKYKHCCARREASMSAQLRQQDQAAFYRIWLDLIIYVNDRMKVTPYLINDAGINQEDIHKVREVLWEKPQLIDDYIREEDLSPEEVAILISWKTHHIKGIFVIMEYRHDYAVFMSDQTDDKVILYGVKGISEPVSSTLMARLPMTVETVLLPFKDQIIYDSFLSRWPVGFGEGMQALFRDMYKKGLEDGILTSLAGGTQ